MGVEAVGQIGFAAALCLAAMGSALGTGAAGMAAIGAWKKCFQKGKEASFLLIVFAGAPFTQTLYGFLLMKDLFAWGRKMTELGTFEANYMYLLAAGIFGGLGMGFSAWMQGKAAACAADAFAETDKGFVNYLIAVGIIEAVALFVWIFLMITVKQLIPAAA